jgi:hypothetical protein
VFSAAEGSSPVEGELGVCQQEEEKDGQNFRERQQG